ncbi:MAG: 3-deoxy-D-manno-octulosonic acid transferase [Candidatus Omnitrophota bacterium]
MWLFYDLLFFFLLLFFIPLYLLKGKFHPGILRRFSCLPQAPFLDHPIWVHAVSVGEANAVRRLLTELRSAYPKKRMVISTVTATGNKVALGLARPGDFVTYLPLDFSFTLKAALDKISPSLFIIVETEIWPNLIYYLSKNRIPIALVNARISDKSFVGYRAAKFFFKPVLQRINLFCAQTAADAERLTYLGAKEDAVRLTGNIKFDNYDYAGLKEDGADYKEKLGLTAQEKLLVAGSTHPGEEGVILGVYRELLKTYPNLRLFLAPRHPQRAKEVAKLVEKLGFPFKLSSNLGRLNADSGLPAVVIIDAIGELLKYYASADIVFVGGSLVKKGGQNILEPAALGKAVIFGPYMHNFRGIAELFLKQNAALMVYNNLQLKQSIADLLNNPGKAEELGRKAKILVEQNKGATGLSMKYISRLISM